MFSLLAARARKNHSKNYFNTVMSDSPLGYWRLGEASGTVATDSGTGSNSGTYTSCTQGTSSLIANNFGNLAVSGNGTSSQIVLGAVSALYGLNRNCTIELWSKPASITGGFGLWSAGYQGIGFRQNNSNLELLSDYSVSLHTFTAGLSIGATFHIVLTIDGAGLCTVYVNGTSVGTYSTSTTFIGAYARIGADGRDSTTVANFFSGSLDEVAVYTSALSSARVSAHYTAGV